MGIYSEYLDRQLTFQDLTAERKTQLRRISHRRGGRDVLVVAADLNKGQAPISINYSDILAVSDQLANLHGDALDLILESPGGSGEVADDIVRLIRDKYTDVAVIVPGWAKSAATIMVMAADEILMESASALGPIDAQLAWQGKTFSADALIEGMEKIKKEVEETGVLNKAYIPVLQGISPGELQSAENALKFAKRLVTDWLAQYKFKNWTTHSSDGRVVTEDDRRERANQVAGELCNHRRWLTHGLSLKISDLEGMRLHITDYSKDDELADAIRRYYTLLQMTFSGNVYKMFETSQSQIMRFFLQQQVPLPQQAGSPEMALIDAQCGKCQTSVRVQANLDRAQPLQAGCVEFPADNKIRCPNCGNEMDLSDARRQLEMQTKKRVIT